MVETDVREHTSQHDALGSLPLITRSAEVTEVERMDRDRRPEVTDAVDQYLTDHGLVRAVELLGVPPERIESEGFG